MFEIVFGIDLDAEKERLPQELKLDYPGFL